jgi:23S rRNA (guanosine2251-2'-O)-methyltransferase
MLVYGRNVLKELDKKKIRKIYVCSNELTSYLQENGYKYEFVPKQRLDNMVKGNHQGIVIDIYDYEYYTLDDIDSNFVVILDHLEDPHNFGSIIRSCECAGVEYIIIPKDRSVTVNDTVFKVSVGAISHVKIVMVSNLVNAIKKLQKDNYFIYAADMDGEDYRTIDYAEKKVLIIGNEGSGISNVVRDKSDVIVSIPMKGTINSLNAGVSAGILLYGMIRNDK